MKLCVRPAAILFLLAGCWMSSLKAASPIAIDNVQRKENVSFEKEILPLLQKNCLACHSASEKQGGLVLESPAEMLRGGDSGPAIIAGRGNESLLLKLASHQTESIMPPEKNDVAAKNLTPAELGLLKLWIDQGGKGSGGIDSLSPRKWRSLPAGVHSVQALSISEDGQFLACSRANQIFLYHIPTGQLITKLADASLDAQDTTGIAHRDLVQSLAFNVDGDLLASGGFREVKLWRRPRDKQRLHFAVGTVPTAATISPDKRWLALAGKDYQIRLFQIEDGKAGAILNGHADAVTSLRFTPDSQQIVSGSKDRSVRVWNVSDGKQQAVLETLTPVNALELVGREAPTEQVPYPPQWLVTGDSEKNLQVWEFPFLAVGAASVPDKDATAPPESKVMPIRQIAGHSQAITALATDPERLRHLYSSSLDGTIRRWNLDNGQQVGQFNHGGPVTAIAVSPDGSKLASAGENKTAKLFQTSGPQIAEMRGDVRRKVNQTRATQQLTSANARLAVSKRLFEDAEKDVPKKTEAEKELADALAEANKEVVTKQELVNKVRSEKLAAEKSAIDASTAAKDALAVKEQAELVAKNAAQALQVAQGKLTQLQRVLTDNPENAQLKELVAAAQKDLAACQQTAQQTTEAVKGPTQKVQEMTGTANALAQKVSEVQKPFNDATTELNSASAKQNLLSQQHALAAKELKDAQTLVPLRKEALARAEAAKVEAEKLLAQANELIQSAEHPLRSIHFSSDGSVVATAGDFESLHTWDGKTGEALAAFAGHTGPLRNVLFVDAETFLSIGEDQSCRVWEMNPRWVLEKTIGKIEDPNIIIHRATSVDFSRDSTRLLIASGVPSRSGELQVFSLRDESRVLYLPQAHDDVIYAARFSPDGKRIASVGADKYLRSFDIATSTQLRRFEGHTNYVLGVSWKSDGETIATSGADNTIKIWEAETGDQRRTISQQLTKHMTAVHFVGDTGNLVSCSGDKRVRLYNGDNGGLTRTFSELKAWVHCVAATPDGKVVACGDASGTVTLWNGTNGQLLHTLDP